MSSCKKAGRFFFGLRRPLPLKLEGRGAFLNETTTYGALVLNCAA